MKVLGFDPGSKKTGVAVGNSLTETAQPLMTWQIADKSWGSDSFLQMIDQLIKEWRPQKLVVGLAETADGKVQAQQRRSRRFAELLNQHTKLSVELVDERLSSQAAEHKMAAMSAKQKKIGIDAVAAGVIVERYLQNPQAVLATIP